MPIVHIVRAARDIVFPAVGLGGRARQLALSRTTLSEFTPTNRVGDDPPTAPASGARQPRPVHHPSLRICLRLSARTAAAPQRASASLGAACPVRLPAASKPPAPNNTAATAAYVPFHVPPPRHMFTDGRPSTIGQCRPANQRQESSTPRRAITESGGAAHPWLATVMWPGLSGPPFDHHLEGRCPRAALHSSAPPCSRIAPR